MYQFSLINNVRYTSYGNIYNSLNSAARAIAGNQTHSYPEQVGSFESSPPLCSLYSPVRSGAGLRTGVWLKVRIQRSSEMVACPQGERHNERIIFFSERSRLEFRFRVWNYNGAYTRHAGSITGAYRLDSIATDRDQASGGGAVYIEK